MLKRYSMDLHVHTCMSPCGASESVPTRIVAAALKQQLLGVAICDHNASENAASVRKAAEGSGITVFGGIEITSQSEIHILGIFDDDNSLRSMQELIYDHLEGKNDSNAFGQQYIVDHEDYVVGYNDHLLFGATDLDIETIISAVHERDGLAIASHIDREAFGIISQLGIIPDDLELDALELSRNYRVSKFSLEGLEYPFVTFSDAHVPEDVGTAATDFFLAEPTVRELKTALSGRDGRYAVSEVT